MELLESQDPEKKRLIETSERHKRELEKEVTAMTEKTEKMLTNALIIGGSLLATYLVVSSLSGGKKKKKKKYKTVKAKTKDPVESSQDAEDEEDEDSGPSFISQMGTRVLSQASVILLNVAKDKLFEYLESRKKPNENS